MNHPTITQISLDFVINTDISPDCDVQNSGNPALDCATNPVGAVEEYIYVSQPVAIPGIPPANGWHFTWDSCCRNGAISNLALTNPTSPSEGFTLRASMFSYIDTNGIALRQILALIILLNLMKVLKQLFVLAIHFHTRTMLLI